MTNETRGQSAASRMTALGITKSEFAQRAHLDRGTLDRALHDEPRVSERTWAKIEGSLDALEHELGMAESGHMVTSTVEYRGARITMQGTPADVAAALREILG